jgi:hypothetical protein
VLNPDARSLYTSALTPPPGLVFDEGIATTFSLDPTTLLSIPVHLALLATDSPDQLSDGIPVLESIRRLSSRITVYAQRGRLQAPGSSNVLYGLLEGMLCEVRAPRRGQFHPKLWLLHFTDPSGEFGSHLRLIVLSRNLTTDRSWDLALRLEGESTSNEVPENQPLVELVTDLPNMAFNAVTKERKDQAERLATTLRQTRWMLPSGFDSISFSVLGRDAEGWKPARCRRLAVVSPFCSDEALRKLARLSTEDSVILSRPETLLGVNPETLAMFEQRYTLAEEAETEDGESSDEISSSDMVGLHAKVYVFERGWNTHLVIGSGNATNAALVVASNIEVMAEMVGRRSRVGGIDSILGEDGFGPYLREFTLPEDKPEPDLDLAAAEEALYNARRALAEANIKVVCARWGDEDRWSLKLEGELPTFENIKEFRAWPITIPEDLSLDLLLFRENLGTDFGPITLSAITGLIAFELKTNHPGVATKLVLNLPIEGLPEGREAAIYRTVINNKDAFFRYLLLLLNGEEPGGALANGSALNSSGSWEHRISNGIGLLEELTRTYSTSPERLEDVDKIIRNLTEVSGGEAVVTPEFLSLWSVFEKALGSRNG